VFVSSAQAWSLTKEFNLMAEYITANDILTLISNNQFIQFTDDDADGVADSGVLDLIITDCSNQVDAFVSSIYTTPFTAPYPSKVREACLVFVCEALYARRLTPSESNPFTARANLWRKILEDVGSGGSPLDGSIPRTFRPGVAITTPSIVNDNTM
jgi:phage gp36-like protein